MITELHLASIFIFLLTSLSLYAIILSRKYFFVLLFLIPTALSTSLYTGYIVYTLQGTPIVNKLPEEKIEILFVQPAKPWIYLLLTKEDSETPEYHKIDHTENNLEQLKKAMEAQDRGEKGEQQGQFKRQTNSDSNSNEFTFIDSSQSTLPTKDYVFPNGLN